MTSDPRITVSDFSLAQRLGDEIVVGRAFAFVGKRAFVKPELSWIAYLFGQSEADKARVISLLGKGTVSLPGATIKLASLPPFRLSSVTSDKAIYHERRDEVHLLALDPLAPWSTVTLDIMANGMEFERRPARLDGRGMASVTLRDLPGGSYAVRFHGVPDDEPACTFTVAEYRLVPLVASVVDRKMQGHPLRLLLKLRLESYGVPVEGPVRVELTEAGRRVDDARVDAMNGVADVSFALAGPGPFAVNVQLVADPSRTASVPIVGSRQADREATVFSSLGTQVTGSLLPGEESREVRGIYLEEGAQHTSVFSLRRVDARKATLTSAVATEAVRVVVLDPTFPSLRPGVVEASSRPHPESFDESYREGVARFTAGDFAAARDAFERGSAAQTEPPHPYYAYFVACCLAREGDRDRALTSLREAVELGWTDFHHMRADDDLAALRGLARFESLTSGGYRELTFDALSQGQTIEIDVPEPVSVVAIGAFARDRAWEGWAALLAPGGVSSRIVVPEAVEPGAMVDVEVETGGEASVYLVVKDARLLAPDTPASRLAGQIKGYVEGASKRLAVGPVTTTLASLTPPPPPPMMPYPASPSYRVPGAMPVGMAFAGNAPTGSLGPVDAIPMGRARRAPNGPPAAAEGGIASAAPPAAPPRPATTQEPEVLFAGIVETTDGKARARIRVAEGVADYVAEAFVLSGLDWDSVDARFRASRETFVDLSLPVFVHPEDTAVGRATVAGVSGRLLVRVTRDGVEVPLVVDGRPLEAGQAIEANRAEVAFLVGEGAYVATVEDGGERFDTARRRVESPGKLRRLARTLRFLEKGETVSRDLDPSIRALRVLPSLDKPFRALVDATSDYGHACCEQTAAKMLAACAMYALSGSDGERRARAEAIILAGVRREQSMWLRGRGFKMYPESGEAPDSYWGPKATRHLWNLDLLAGANGSASPALANALREGLAMAGDTTRAYGLAWPPSQASSCEEAYAVMRFGQDAGAHRRALDFVRERTDMDSKARGAVECRVETAYGSAALLRGGESTDLRRALALANSVVEDLGADGRLYSTVDSVAAIALMAEMRAARILDGGGTVSVDGRRMSANEAVRLDASAREISCVEGVVPVEVEREREEDWEALGVDVPLVVAVEKAGRPMRRFATGDALDLRIKLEAGYKAGDLAWVCLPDALSRVVGGGQVKRFAVDFEGRDEVLVPLAATGVTVDRQGGVGTQRFAVCVRNMFEEERAGNPGLIEVTVTPASDASDGASALSRMFEGLRGLFGAR